MLLPQASAANKDCPSMHAGMHAEMLLPTLFPKPQGSPNVPCAEET
jgi:hypothetical protein